MKSSPILILGANGQVGRALIQLAANAVGVTRKEIDLEKIEFFSGESCLKPSAIINAAAYTAVDKAEVEEISAFNINARAPEILAKYCKAHDIPFIHYSTDYVFDGSGSTPWKETDTTNPLSVYGRTKREGEMRIESMGGKYLIFRTSWVYDETGKNFLNTMLRLGAEREELRVVNDQWGAPTYARHLAAATLQALENAGKASCFPSGIYHLCGGGETSWAGFAEMIFHLFHREKSKSAQTIPGDGPHPVHDVRRHLPNGEVKIVGIPTADYPTPAIRPLNSRLDCSKAAQVLGIEMPDWRQALLECMAACAPHRHAQIHRGFF